MWEWVKQNWRELVGWLMIALFTFYYGSAIGRIVGSSDRLDAIRFFFLVLTVLVLAWLWLNRK